MKKINYIFPLFILLFSCNSNKEKVDSETELIKDDPTLVINRVLGDTLETGINHPFDTLGRQTQRGVKAYLSKGAIPDFDTFNLNRNVGVLQLAAVKPFIQDSSTNLTHTASDSLPPKVVHVVPVKIDVKEPEQVLLSQAIYNDNAQFDIRCLSTDQGLPSNNILDMVKDENGFLWLATDKGLVKYDGVSVKTYDEKSGLPDRYITCLALDLEDNIWLGTRSAGFVKYDGSSFYNYSIDSISLGRETSYITFDHNNNMWATIRFGGVVRFDQENFHIYQGPQGMMDYRPTTSVSVDEENTKWVTAFGYGLYSIAEDGEFRRYHRHPASPLSSYVNHGIVDHNGYKILSFWGCSFAEIREDSVYKYNISGLPCADIVQEIIEDSKGNLWVCGYGAGVYYVNRENGKVEFYGEENGLSSIFVTDIFLDEFDGLWVGSEGGGLNYLKRNSFKVTSKYNGLNDELVYGISQSKDKTYYATNRGLLIRDSLGFKKLVSANGRSRFDQVAHDVLIDSKDNIWISCLNAGIVQLRADGSLLRLGTSHGVPHNPMCLDTTSNGNVWGIGMNADIVQFQDTNVYYYNMENGYALHNSNDLLITDEDVFWIGSADNGVARIENDSIQYITRNEGLKSDVINHIGEDNSGRIWVCTEEGLNYIENGQVESVNDPRFGTSIQSLIQDEEGRYWIASEGALIALEPRLAPQETFKLADYKVFKFDKGNGLKNASFLMNSIFIDADKNLLIGSRGGLVSLSLENLMFDTNVPTAYLQAIRINGTFIDMRSLKKQGDLENLESSEDIELGEIEPFNNYSSSIKLPHHLNHLTFEFSGIDWNDPHHLAFEYYLEGYENNWNSARKNHVADYRNLSYGDYTFHLKSVSRNGQESEETTYSFTIKRPWWHSWWARTIFVLLFILLIFGIVKWRTAELRKRQKVLEDEIHQATQKIRKQKELVELQKEDVEKAHDELNTKNQEILDSINYAKRIQNAILPSQKLMQEQLRNSFVFYRPKDIVAGDFYWMEVLKEDVLFAAADCTGHGVPGAMVSVICNGSLNRSVREFGLTNPGKILDKTRELVIEEFMKSDEDVKDGMDIALCKLKLKNGKGVVEYAGAHNPMWIIRKGAEEMEEIKANKQPIGVFDKVVPYTTHTVELNAGDTFYIFTDGYSDQFGGDKGKKMKASNFKKLLLSIQDKTMEEQLEFIYEQFENWKGEFEQLDDVCVIGVRL